MEEESDDLIQMILSKIFFTCLLGYILAGCGEGPTPRLMDLVGKDAFGHRGLPPKNDEWSQVPKIGLVVHSDARGQYAAPAIIAPYLETLTRRTEKFLRERCSFQEIVPVPPLSEPVNLS
jgi:hypothetical protein